MPRSAPRATPLTAVAAFVAASALPAAVRRATCALAVLAVCAASAPMAVAQERLDTGGAIAAAEAVLETGMHDGRRYGLHVPASVSGPLPLLIVLHGAGGNFANVAARTGFHSRAPEALVLYPDSAIVDDGDRRTRRWDPYGRRGDEIGHFIGLIDAIAARHPVDRARIYVAGMSNGAAMAQALGCRLPGIAGIAPVAAAISPRAHEAICAGRPTRPVAFIGFMGTVDRRGEAAKYAASVDLFARRAGCAARYVETALPDPDPDDGVSVTLRTARAPDGGPCPTPVHHYRIEGGGHFWPGAPYTQNALRRQAAEGAGHAAWLDATGRILAHFGLAGG